MHTCLCGMLRRQVDLLAVLSVPKKAAVQLTFLGKRSIYVTADNGPNASLATVLTREWMLACPNTIVRVPCSHCSHGSV